MGQKKFLKRQQNDLSLVEENSRVRLELVDGEFYEGVFLGWEGAKMLLSSINKKKRMRVNPIFIENCYEELRC